MERVLASDVQSEKAGLSKVSQTPKRDLSAPISSVRPASEPNPGFRSQLYLGFTWENSLQV